MRIGKDLAEVIVDESLDIQDEENFIIRGYCEPFCGMLGVYQYIPELLEEDIRRKLSYKAGDTNTSLIKMWKRAQKGWKPPTRVSEKKYNELKYAKDSALRAYAGFQYSFGGQFFMGYAPRYGKTADSSKASKRVQTIAKKLKNVKFTNGPYTQFSKLKGYIIYCDPPYSGTNNVFYKKNTKKLKFDQNEFWDWCRDMSENNIVFISNYKAPRDFECIYSSTHKLTGKSPKKGKRKRTEKLYLIY